MIRRATRYAPQSTRPGAHGTVRLFGFVIRYDEDMGGQPRDIVYRWCYDLDHAWYCACEELEDDGAEVIEVFRARIMDVAVNP